MAITSVISASRCIMAGHIATASSMGLAVVVSTVVKNRVDKMDFDQIRSLAPFQWSTIVISLGSVLTLGGLGCRLHPICGIALGTVYGIAAGTTAGLFGYDVWTNDNNHKSMPAKLGRIALALNVCLSGIGMFATGADLSYRLSRLLFRVPMTLNSAARGSLTLGFAGMVVGIGCSAAAGTAWGVYGSRLPALMDTLK